MDVTREEAIIIDNITNTFGLDLRYKKLKCFWQLSKQLERLLGEFLASLKSEEPVIGPWVSFPYPSCVEIICQAGFPFLLADGEHGHVSVSDLPFILPITELNNCDLIYRVPHNRKEYISAALDQGATGIMVPMIEDMAGAELAVSAAKYSPIGNRGIGPLRASKYYNNFDNYRDSANSNSALILQIESKRGLKCMPEVVQLKGVDGLFAGPADLSDSLGIENGSDELLLEVEKIARAAKSSAKFSGIDCNSASQIPLFREMGFSMFTIGGDTVFLAEGAAKLRAKTKLYLESTVNSLPSRTP